VFKLQALDVSAQGLKLALQLITTGYRWWITMAGHGFWGFTPKSLILPVVQRLAAHAYCFGYLACARAPGAQLDDCRPLLLLRVWCNDPNFANDAAPGVGDVCVD